MRKLLNYALAAILAVGLVPAAAFAEPSSDDGVDVFSSDPIGEVNVTLKREDALAETVFTIKMTPSPAADGSEAQGEAIEGTATAKKLEEKSFLVLPHVKNGVYTLEISAPRYLTYTVENVVVDDNCVNVDVYELIGKNEGRGVGNPTDQGYLAPVGVIPVGDLDGNGVINDADADIMSKAIERGDASYDLTGDDKVDIADLSVVVRNEGATNVVTPYSGTPSKVIVAAIQDVNLKGSAKKSDGTELQGKELAAALIDKTQADSKVTLSPKNSEAISDDNPVSLTLETGEGSDKNLSDSAQAIVIAAPTPTITVDPDTGETVKTNASTMTAGTVTVQGDVLDENGDVTEPDVEITAEIGGGAAEVAAYGLTAFAAREAAKGVTIENDGSVIIDLGKRVAIKKVTIDVTKVSDPKNPELAEIATVEFLQDFEKRIPEPQLSIPTIDASSITFSETDRNEGTKKVSLSWDKQTNITGYEVSIAGPGYTKTAITEGDKASDSRYVSYTFAGSKTSGTAKSGNDYTFRVRSVNGNWRSNWSEPVTKYCDFTNAPATPEYVTATVGVQSLNISWRCKYDGVSYTVQYAKGPASSINWSSSAVTTVENVKTTSHQISGLEGGSKYAFRVMAHNPKFSSGWSSPGEAIPRSSSLTTMPKYDLINTDNPSAGNLANTHIKTITGVSNKSYTIYKKDGSSVTNATAKAEDWNALIDNDSESYLYIADWDSGVAYDNFRGPSITLDQPTTMDTIRVMPSDKHASVVNGANIRYLGADNKYYTVGTQFTTKYDKEGRKYYEIVAREKFTTSYLELRLTTGYTRVITIADLKLYNYNPLDDDIAAIFTDDQRLEVKQGVTEEQVNALIARSSEVQPGTESAAFPNGEMHPHHDLQMTDLNYALEFIKNGATAEVLTVDNQITATGSPANGMAMALSDYQSLGRVAAAGDTVVIYVTDVDGATVKGNNVNLRLVATQMHPEVNAWQSSAIQLKAGRNEVTIPRIGSYAQESGGALYLQYTGAKGAKNYTVRVTGGDKIPMLNVDGITGEARTAAIEKYVAELNAYVPKLAASHVERHEGSSNAMVNDYQYDKANCILNYTDIQIDNMMYSLPADACLASIGTDAGKLERAIAGMEQEIDYFYQFKGMNRAATDKDAYPFMRLNVRYHRMFTGAFMYAGGKHIGIEYGSTGGAFRLAPVATDTDGNQRATFTGWGLSHEIGHVINAAAYVLPEVTNNVFAQLAKSMSEGESNAKFRTAYKSVYAAVTGQTGSPSKQLAMYWQLHLAYDDASIYKLYDESAAGIAEQQKSLFYARMESYLRDPSKAPFALTTTAGDQGLMQAACAAANKDCLDFFRAWGLIPSADTEAYAAQFSSKETRKIQYIDDDSRNYRIQGKTANVKNATVSAEIVNAVDRRIRNTNQVEIALSINSGEEALLGYEIKRNDKVIAFVTPNDLKNDNGKMIYVDTIKTENNKTFNYTVTAIDRLLNETPVCAIPEVKVQHDGSIDKTGWLASTTATSPRDNVVEKDDDDPESGVVNGNTKPGVEIDSAVKCVLDNDKDTVYYGTGTTSVRPSITLDMGRVEQVTALKFTPAARNYAGDAATPEGGTPQIDPGTLYKYRLFGYKIETSVDGTNWTIAKQGNAITGNASNDATWVYGSDVISNDDGSYTLYFNKMNEDGTADPFMYTYDARYVRLTSTNMSAIAVAELDVLGPTSDNVELVPEGFGKLESDYVYDSSDGKNHVIPAGSIVFYGEYRGDPSYNVVLLRNQDGTVLNGEQLFFAEVPEKGMLGETSDGRWIFWLDGKDDAGNDRKDQIKTMTSVQVSLYRVQDALTLAGQRVTSTSLTMTMPDEVPNVTIKSDTAPSKMQPASGENVLAANEGEVAAMSARVEGDTVVTSLGSVYTIEDEPTVEAEEETATEPLFGIFAFGDTGVTPYEAPSTPVQLTATDTGFEAIAHISESVVAARASFVIDPASPCNVTPIVNGNNNVYKYYSYEGGVLNVMTVARTGVMGANASLSVTIDGFKSETTLKTSSYKEMAEHSYVVAADFEEQSATFKPAAEEPTDPEDPDNPPVDPEDPDNPQLPEDPDKPVNPIEPDRDIQNATSRIAGATSVQTSVDISKTAYPDGCEWVVVARSDDFQDAMSATALAGAIDCPILTTDRTTTSQEIVAEAYRLGAKNAYIIGGSVALPADVEGDLDRIGISSTRIAGENAWDTSVACAKAVASFGNKAGRDVIIATSVNFQDALSISGFAFKFGVPIFLTDTSGKLTSEANEVITELGGNVYVAGGNVVVPRTTAEVAYGTRVIRLAGINGYDTSNQIANYMIKSGYLDNKAVCIASGDQAAKGLDALTGAALAGKNDAPVLLVSGSKLPGAEPWNNTVINGYDSEGSRGFVAANAMSLGKMYILGGSGIIDDDMRDDIHALVKATYATDKDPVVSPDDGE